MEKLVNKRVVEHNELITSVAKMDQIPLKIFELAVSQLNTDDPPKDNIVYLSKKMLFDFFGLNKGSSSKHTRFKEALTNLHQQSIFEIREVKDNGKWNFKIISPLESSEWNEYNDTVKIQFTNSIMPYLIDLKKNFTQYLIMDIRELKSKYSLIIYKWISMNYNQYSTYKMKGNRRLDQLDKLKNPYISMDELRRMTDTIDEYKRMSNFDARILKIAKKEINTHTHFNIEYEKIRKGRTIEGILFKIDKKIETAPLPYKEDDYEYQKHVLIEEQDKQRLLSQALESRYTTLLNNYLIIGLDDIRDITIMAGLQLDVYPLYDRLKYLRGFDGVEDHIKYVASHKQGYSRNKQNIKRYLQLSIERYLTTVKIQNANDLE